MAVKIKNLNKKPTELRTCGVCGKLKEMNKFERFCTSTCRQTAAEMDKFGSEFRLALHNGKR